MGGIRWEGEWKVCDKFDIYFIDTWMYVGACLVTTESHCVFLLHDVGRFVDEGVCMLLLQMGTRSLMRQLFISYFLWQVSWSCSSVVRC
jgi:hypothetical protein